MNLTSKARYAVMAMVDLKMQGEDGPVTLSDIAERQNIALNYLEQIFMKLRKNKLVKSIRGPGGGYVLGKNAQDITIASIVLAVDESIHMTRCHGDPVKGCQHGGAKCVTHNLWEGLTHQINQYLNSISLLDVCRDNIPVEDADIMGNANILHLGEVNA